MIDIFGVQSMSGRQPELTKTPPIPQGLNEVEGFTRFYIGANINIDTFKDWSPQRITDFFNGVA